MNDAGSPFVPQDSENAWQTGFDPGAAKPYRVLARKYRPAGFEDPIGQ